MNPSDELLALHAQIDARVKTLEAEHAGRMACGRGCSGCCVDDLTVFAVEAARIRAAFPDVLRETPHPPGRCAFLGSDGACRVYLARPYVCRTQGLPLRWIDEEAEAEYRDICALNDETGEAVEELPVESCWTLGETEARLRELQAASGEALRRVALRSLFE